VKNTFGGSLFLLAPVLVSLSFGVFCTWLVLSSMSESFIVAPFPEGAFSVLNAVYFVVLTSLGASLLYVLLRRNKLRIITIITGFALSAAVFLLSMVYLYSALSAFTIPNVHLLTLLLSLLITAAADLTIFRSPRASNIVVLFVGGALGAFLGVSIPALSAMLILGFLAVYDVFAVYRGPVGKIARSGIEHLRGLSFSFRGIQMGLGDLTFYSMLTGCVFANLGAYSCLASTVGVMVGVFLALKMLEKKGMFPGLPFPIALGMVPLVISLFR